MALEDYDINSDLEFANQDDDDDYDDYWNTNLSIKLNISILIDLFRWNYEKNNFYKSINKKEKY